MPAAPPARPLSCLIIVCSSGLLYHSEPWRQRLAGLTIIVAIQLMDGAHALTHAKLKAGLGLRLGVEVGAVERIA